MNIAILTSNMFFEESLKSLLENYRFKNGISLIVKDFNQENIGDLDVIVTDYNLSEFKEFLSNLKIQKNN